MLAIYCRISRDEDNGPNRSIENQKALGIEMANELGLSFVVYVDQNISGALKNKEDRPAFSGMLDDIIDGKISAVFSTEQDRLERNPTIRRLFIDTLVENNVRLFSSSGEIDLSNTEDEFLGDIKSLINQYYVKITSKKIKRVLKKNAGVGKAHGIVPYGYCRDEKGMIAINQEEAKIVRRIYDMSLNGIGTNKIAVILSDEGIPTRYNLMKGDGVLRTRNKYTGKVTVRKRSDIKWSGRSVQAIIKNSFYKGVREFGGEEFDCPAIFDNVYWRKVNDNLEKNRNNSGKKVSHKYLLKGIIECGHCGRNMYGRSRYSKRSEVYKNDNYYMCSSKRYKDVECDNRSINLVVIEDLIWSKFFEEAKLLKLLQEYFESDKTKIAELKGLVKHQQNKIAGWENEKGKAVGLVVKGLLPESEIRQIIQGHNKAIDDAQIIISNLQQQIKTFESSDILLNDLSSLNQLDISFNDKYEMIRKYVKRIHTLSDHETHTYAIIINFKVDILPQYYVMDFHKRIPYYDLSKAMSIIHNNSAGLKENIMTLGNLL